MDACPDGPETGRVGRDIMIELLRRHASHGAQSRDRELRMVPHTKTYFGYCFVRTATYEQSSRFTTLSFSRSDSTILYVYMYVYLILVD